MIYLTKFKELGVKATVLASSLALVACGGGGGGYYDDNKNTGGSTGNGGNGSTTDTKKVVESLGLTLQDAEAKPIEVAFDNSKVLISVQALNSDKGGVAAKLVNLSIADSEKLGVTSKSSQVTTGDDGVAVFELNIPTLNVNSGKVQLTATVDGTTIKQVYTLNIKKTSTIQSEYNLKIQQGVVLNLPKGSASITAQVTDKNGGVKSNQSVSLALPAEMQGKFSITNGSTLKTDELGKATFNITANSDLTAADIAQLVLTSSSLDFKLVDEFKAESQAKASITFKDVSQVVQKLEIVTQDSPIVAQGGTTQVTVVAKNSDGNLLTNKKVKLSFTDSSAVYGVTIDQAEVTTDAKGYAVFTLKSASSYPIALSQQGINLKATYSDSADIFATATVKVTTADTGASNQQALQRLEIASSYQINAKNDSITITVKGINNKGEAATQGKVKLSLNAEANSNGVTFDGSAEQEFKTGYVTYTLKTNAKTPAAVEALVAAGITATFTTDNNVTNSIKITVEDEAKSEEALSYLAIDPINVAYDYTKDQTIVVKVKATGVKGGALKGETVNLGFSKAYSVSELQSLGLSLTSSADALTDATGYATFTYQYKASGSPTQKALVENGLGLIAKPTNGTGAASTANLNFKAPTAQGEIDLDHLNIDMLGSLILTVNNEKTFDVTVNALGTDGKALANQKVSIGLNDAATSNGASLATAATLTTNAQGQATFKIKVKANNTSELANLVANGLTVAVKGVRTDGSAYTVTRKVEISQPVVVIPDLAALSLSYDVQTVSVLGGEVRVKVIAKDENGIIIPNTSVAIALSSLAGSRVSLSDSNLTTNSKGEAEFTIRVAEGAYDASLIKNGITFAVVGTNRNNGDRIQQTGSIQVAIPQDSVNLRLTADKKELEFGKSYQVQVAVKDELGANTGYPVNLALNKEAYDAGIRLSNDSLVTAANGQTQITITIPKDIPSAAKQALIDLGSKAIQIKGTIKNPKGVDVVSTLEFSIFEAVNPNHLTVDSSKASLSVAGDKTIVKVQLLDNNGLPVRNEDVTLAANNSATLIIGTPGDGHPTNTSKPQTVKTDSNGNAFFSVEVDGNTADGDLLLASGIELTASNTNTNGALTTQIYRLTAFKPSPTAPQPARYNLRIESNKATLNVRNDLANVTVTLVDQNGGGVANKYVNLNIKDFVRNGVIIVGASGLTTDQNGQAVFKVKVDESARNATYTAAAFDADDLNLTATFSEAGYLDATQISRINVVQSVVQNPVASIVIGVNPTETGSSNDGVYYTKNLSVSVVDFDGKPLANQKVEMDINPTNYVKGRYIWALAPVPGSDPVLKWVGPGSGYYNLNNPNIYLNNGIPMNNNGTPADTTDDFPALTTINSAHSCAVTAPYSAITNNEVNSIPVKVPTFLGQGATATYTTDAEGKFDFVIRYPKIYAQWLNVQIGASSQVATLPFRTTYNLGLASVASDYSTDGTYGPNLNSPYGINTTTCP
ncbi:Ig-like domain-containing protein [Acinetobacter guillouiae]|uniref:Ig-like domain-containing protein n=1 Tax=Acinetobacter guillouiae TaxID=106649 RepID=UPI0021CF26FF|nr:Ig-like domain-containing protein [Acinetobacter guillouiae]MCU4491896.1 Ig-like domain-containing protein [Acinetobacter guillouiae]